VAGANGAYLLLTALMGANYQSTEMICLLLCGSVYFGCFQFMLRLGKATTSEPGGKGVLIDPGLDLNMKEGMAEHVKVRYQNYLYLIIIPFESDSYSN